MKKNGEGGQNSFAQQLAPGAGDERRRHGGGLRSSWGYNCIYGGVGGLISRVHVDRTAKPARRDGTEYRPTSLPRRLMGGTLGLPIIGLECPRKPGDIPGRLGIFPLGVQGVEVLISRRARACVPLLCAVMARILS